MIGIDPLNPGPPSNPIDAHAQWAKERAVLILCARALGFKYAGTPRPPAHKHEKRALWDAMHAAYQVLGCIDTRTLRDQGELNGLPRETGGGDGR